MSLDVQFSGIPDSFIYMSGSVGKNILETKKNPERYTCFSMLSFQDSVFSV
jgi:hypothetical protein